MKREHRNTEAQRLSHGRADGGIDLATAVDVAIRDLREILLCWGSEISRQRAEECESTLRRAYSEFVIYQASVSIALGWKGLIFQPH